jgi:type IV pilus assembly protein PilO
VDIHELLERMSKLPRTQRLGIIVLVYLALGAVFWFALYSPKQKTITVLESQQQELETKVAVVKKRAENREEFERELEDLTLQLRQALRQLPDDREIPDLLSRISTIARRIGLEIHRFLPKNEIVHEYHAEVPVELELKGSYHEVAMFFDRLSKLSRIVYVQDITMEEPKESSGKVIVTVTGRLTTFRFLSEGERGKSAAKPDEDGKRRKRR